MSGQLSDRLAITTVVTSGMLEEFWLFRYSFELFHGPGYHWFIRCDRTSAAQLATLPNTYCLNVIEEQKERTSNENLGFRTVVAHKMGVMDDAWKSHNWEAVAFLDADLIATAPFLEEAAEIPGDIVLSPHYYNEAFKEQEAVVGHFNSGFLLARTPEFHRWWYHAFITQPTKWTDQKSVEDAPKHFTTGILREAGNVGFWRRDKPNSLRYNPVPEDCLFFHAHMYQPAQTASEFVSNAYLSELFARRNHGACRAPFAEEQIFYKAFGLHILLYLRGSKVPKHESLLQEILRRDRLGLYAEMLKMTKAA